jgi:hypothetical protein
MTQDVFVASPAAGERLLLRALADPKQQPDHGVLGTTSDRWFVHAEVSARREEGAGSPSSAAWRALLVLFNQTATLAESRKRWEHLRCLM